MAEGVKSEMRGPAEAGPVALISGHACRFLSASYSAALLVSQRVVEKILVSTLKVILKAQDLKAVVSTDDPKL